MGLKPSPCSEGIKSNPGERREPRHGVLDALPPCFVCPSTHHQSPGSNRAQHRPPRGPEGVLPPLPASRPSSSPFHDWQRKSLFSSSGASTGNPCRQPQPQFAAKQPSTRRMIPIWGRGRGRGRVRSVDAYPAGMSQASTSKVQSRLCTTGTMILDH